MFWIAAHYFIMVPSPNPLNPFDRACISFSFNFQGWTLGYAQQRVSVRSTFYVLRPNCTCFFLLRLHLLSWPRFVKGVVENAAFFLRTLYSFFFWFCWFFLLRWLSYSRYRLNCLMMVQIITPIRDYDTRDVSYEGVGASLVMVDLTNLQTLDNARLWRTDTLATSREDEAMAARRRSMRR